MSLQLSLPSAILMGACVCGGAIFAGLHSRPVVDVIAPPQASPEVIPRTATTGMTAAGDSEIARLVRDAVEHDRSRLAEVCWSSKERLAPKDFELRLIFDGKGQLLSYAVNDPGDAHYQDVARCLRRQKPVVAVPAAGHPTTVQFALRLP